jgi:hypothetical protein
MCARLARRTLVRAVIPLAVAVAGCSADRGATVEAGADGDRPPAEVAADAPDLAGRTDAGLDTSGPGYRTELASQADLAALAAEDGAEVKYLAPVLGRPALPPLTARCYFQDMRRFSWHLQFLRSFAELADLSYDAYLSLVLQPASRRLWGGAVQPRPTRRHPTTGAIGVISYSVYDQSGGLGVAEVTEVDRTLKACLSFATEQLVFVAETPAQEALLAREAAALAASGVAAITREEPPSP